MVMVFWCMSSACRIHLHANFYISLCIKCLLWYMYCVSPNRQGEKESHSEWIYLFLCDCLCVCVSDRAAESDAQWKEVERWREDIMCICLDIHLSILTCFVQFLSAPLGHQENSSICDFKLQSFVPLAPWGKANVYASLFFFYTAIST